MRRRVFGRAGVVLAAVAVAAAGCGGDDGPSNAEFVKDANAVCHRHYVKISAAASKVLAGGKLPTPKQFGQLAMGTIIPQYGMQVNELKDVEAPEAKKTAYDKWLADSDALEDELKADPMIIQQPPQLANVNGQSDKLGLSNECHIGAG